MSGLLYVSLPKYTVGLVYDNRQIIRTAPAIARWTRGHDVHRVAEYFRQRGARVLWLEDEE